MTAIEGGLLIIENPEAHLHPAGQSEMGMFLARMAAAGLQILVETHSERKRRLAPTLLCHAGL
jgi:predicted ATPase